MRGRRIWRWLWLVALAVMGMAEPVAAAPQLQTAPFSEGRLSEESAVRAGPGINFVIVGRLPAGQTVTVMGCNQDCTWYQVGDGRWMPAFVVGPALGPPSQPAQLIPPAQPMLPAQLVPPVQLMPPAQMDPAPVGGAYAGTLLSPTGYNPAAMPSMPPADAAPPAMSGVMAQASHLRAGPGFDYPMTGQVAAGQRVVIIHHDGEWCELAGLGWAPTRSVQGTVQPVYRPRQKAGMVMPQPQRAIGPAPRATCHPAYPDVCIAAQAARLTCADIPFRSFWTVPPDPYRFDPDRNGYGCEPAGTPRAYAFDQTAQPR